jgi:hypothetical protein
MEAGSSAGIPGGGSPRPHPRRAEEITGDGGGGASSLGLTSCLEFIHRDRRVGPGPAAPRYETSNVRAKNN